MNYPHIPCERCVLELSLDGPYLELFWVIFKSASLYLHWDLRKTKKCSGTWSPHSSPFSQVLRSIHNFRFIFFPTNFIRSFSQNSHLNPLLFEICFILIHILWFSCAILVPWMELTVKWMLGGWFNPGRAINWKLPRNLWISGFDFDVFLWQGILTTLSQSNGGYKYDYATVPFLAEVFKVKLQKKEASNLCFSIALSDDFSSDIFVC